MTFNRRQFVAAATHFTFAAPWVARAQNAVSPSMIGQMLLVGFAGSTPNEAGAQNLARHIEAGAVGGAVFLGYNCKSRDGIEALTKFFTNAGRSQSPLIAVDQEGGAVQRLGTKLGYPAVPAARDVAKTYSLPQAENLYFHAAEVLKQAGFSLNLAPVVDLGFEPRNPIITQHGRAFAEEGKTVAAYAGAFIDGYRKAGVLTALKHFPGHGSTLGDSHQRPVDLTPTWREEELVPYQLLIKERRVDFIMSGHLSHDQRTGGLPATLSPQAIHGLLRNELGFKGPVITDDLDMAAIRSVYPLKEAIIRAITAGNDMVMLSNSAHPDANLPLAAREAVLTALREGQISPRTIEQAVERLQSVRVS